MKKQIAELEKLTSVVESGERAEHRKRAGGRSGRFGMKVAFEKWTVEGTRPESDRGVTFHFKHSFITKGRHASKGYRDQTPSAAHQSYIERESAVEDVSDSFWEQVDPLIEPGTQSARGPRWKVNIPDDMDPLFIAPPIYRDPGHMSFGTTGASRRDREDFWRALEQSEGRRGRVQNRIILELPYELDASGRLALTREFCRIFEEKQLAYWATIHAPSGHNDKRNYHLHIAYSDRPARITTDGTWDFTITREIKGSNRAMRTRRPYRMRKDRTAQGRQWIVALRRRFSDIANFHLSLAGLSKRYDPRSYKESGIAKEPTRHLGTKAFIAETYGIPTRRGLANARREVAFRMGMGESIFSTRDEHIRHIERRLAPVAMKLAGDKEMQKITQSMAAHEALGHEGRQAYKRREIHRIAGEAVSIRLQTRTAFLEKETDRLYFRPPRGREHDAFVLASVLTSEKLLIEKTQAELKDFTASCSRIAKEETARLASIDRHQEMLLEEILEQEIRLMEVSGTAKGRQAAEHQKAFELAWLMEKEDFSEVLSPDANDAARKMSKIDERDNRRARIEQMGEVQISVTDVTKPANDKSSRRKEDIEEIASAITRDLGHVDEPATPEEKTPDEQRGSPASPRETRFDIREDATAGKSRSKAKEVSPIDAAVAAMTGEKPEERQNPYFAGAEILPLAASADDIRDFEKKLSSVTNRDLRGRAFATRDAADLSDDEAMKKRYASAWTVIQGVAARRGLDLETGRHDPEKALDKAMARIHMDSATELPEHILTGQKKRGIV